MITNSKEQTTGGYNDMDGSQKMLCSEKEDRHKRVLTIWFNFYEFQEQRWFSYSDIILVADSRGGACIPLSLPRR